MRVWEKKEETRDKTFFYKIFKLVSIIHQVLTYYNGFFLRMDGFIENFVHA